ncbi:MAG: hypothetical protein K2U26_17710 [Cyclobacteriaceae bacterium]|nr:hypothetical protein [Cyclobacteriaceae bacterium]
MKKVFLKIVRGFIGVTPMRANDLDKYLAFLIHGLWFQVAGRVRLATAHPLLLPVGEVLVIQ